MFFEKMMAEQGIRFAQKKTRKSIVKPKTFAEKVDVLIQEQLDLTLNNIQPKTQAGKTKKSWFNPDKGTVFIKLGLFPLFVDPLENVTSKDKFVAILTALKNWREDPYLKSAIDQIDIKAQELTAKKKKSRN